MIKYKNISGNKLTEFYPIEKKDTNRNNNYGQTAISRIKFTQIEGNQNEKLGYAYHLSLGDTKYSIKTAAELQEIVEFLQDSIKILEANPSSNLDD